MASTAQRGVHGEGQPKGRLEGQLREHIIVCRHDLTDDEDDEELDICHHDIVIISKKSLLELVDSRKRLRELLDAEENVSPMEDIRAIEALYDKELATSSTTSESPAPDGVTPHQLTMVLDHIGTCLPRIQGGANKFDLFKDCSHSVVVISKDVVERSLGEQAILEVQVELRDETIAMLEQKIAAQSQNIDLLKETNEILEENNAMLGRLRDAE